MASYELERPDLVEHIAEKLAGQRFVLLTGSHGTGRATLARQAIERLGKQDVVCRLRGEDLATGTLEALLSERSLDLEAVEVFLIVGLDKFLARDQRETAFSIFEHLAEKSKVKLVATCHELFAEFCVGCLGPQIDFPIVTVEVPPLSGDELNELLQQSSVLSDQEWLSELPNQALTLYSLGVAESIDWPQVEDKPKTAREFRNLLREELTRRLGTEKSQLHQAYEEWCLLHWLDQRFADCDYNMQTFAESLPTHLSLRQAYRTWLFELANLEPKKAGFLVEGALRDLEQPWSYRHDVLETLLKHEKVEESLAAVLPRFRADDALLLRRLIGMLERYEVPRTVLPARLWTSGWTETAFLKDYPRAGSAKVVVEKAPRIPEPEPAKPEPIVEKKRLRLTPWALKHLHEGPDEEEPKRWRLEYFHLSGIPLKDPAQRRTLEWYRASHLALLLIRHYWEQADQEPRDWCFERFCFTLEERLAHWEPVQRNVRAHTQVDRQAGKVLSRLWTRELTFEQRERLYLLFPRVLLHPVTEIREYVIWGLSADLRHEDEALVKRCINALYLEGKIRSNSPWDEDLARRVAGQVADGFWAISDHLDLDLRVFRKCLGQSLALSIGRLLRVVSPELAADLADFEEAFPPRAPAPAPKVASEHCPIAKAVDQLTLALETGLTDSEICRRWSFLIARLSEGWQYAEMPLTDERWAVVMEALFGTSASAPTMTTLSSRAGFELRFRRELMASEWTFASLFQPELEALGLRPPRTPDWLIAMLGQLKNFIERGYVLPPYVLRQCERYLGSGIVRNPDGLKSEGKPLDEVLWFLELCTEAGSKTALQLAVDYTTEAY